MEPADQPTSPTPEPWFTDVEGSTLRIVGQNGVVIATIGDVTIPRNVANARLIAESPNLLEGCTAAKDALANVAEMLRAEIEGRLDDGLRRINCAALMETTTALALVIQQAEDGRHV